MHYDTANKEAISQRHGPRAEAENQPKIKGPNPLKRHKKEDIAINGKVLGIAPDQANNAL